MKRVWSSNDFDFYTYMLRILTDLELDNSDYLWLISDIDAYPGKKEYEELLLNREYILLTTSELINMIKKEDFQWVWAVFSAIPSHYHQEDILKFELPHIESFTEEQYNPYEDEPRLQHPYAELEILCSESGVALISNDDKLINRFRRCYPNYTDYFPIHYHSLKAIIKDHKEIADDIYICNFLNCDLEKMKHTKISLVKNIFGRYVVTEWQDYEYGRYSERKEFSDKDLAAVYAWKLFVNNQKGLGKL